MVSLATSVTPGNTDTWQSVVHLAIPGTYRNLFYTWQPLGHLASCDIPGDFRCFWSPLVYLATSGTNDNTCYTLQPLVHLEALFPLANFGVPVNIWNTYIPLVYLATLVFVNP